MIDPSVVCFPANIVDILALVLQEIDPPSTPGGTDGLRIVKRPIHPTDATETVSIVAGTWTPEDESRELGQREPTLQRYAITVEAMVKDMDQERGIATHSLLSTHVRHMLYRDPALVGALPELSVTLRGYTEHLKDWGVRQQRFLNNKFNGEFYFLSAVDLWFRTDIQL